MKRLLFPLLVLILCVLPFLRARAQEITPAPSPTPVPFAGLTAPAPGQALQGLVTISGSTPVERFQSAELSFNYAGASSPSWFLVAEFDAAPNGTLAQWDTTRLTDGVYDLRLLVTRTDGTQQVSTIQGLRVRNYSPIETNTPLPRVDAAEAGGSFPGTPASREVAGTPESTRTTLPPNPAQLPTGSILVSLGRGALVVLGVFAIFALYAWLKGIRDKG